MSEKKRLNHNNLFFMLNDCDGVTEEDLYRLDECEYPNVLVFTSRNYPNHRCTFFLPCFADLPSVGNTMIRSKITGKLIIEEYFDLVGWFNQNKGSELEKYRIK